MYHQHYCQQKYHKKSCIAASLLVLCALIVLCFPVTAQESCEDRECVSTNQLEVAFGLGLGVRTNPLYNSDNIPLVIVPDVAWYGDNWYLDNTEVGYQWQWSEDFAFETFVALNNTYADFNRGNISNFVLDGLADSSFTTTEEGAPGLAPDLPDSADSPITPPFENNTIANLSPEDVADRDAAGDIGIRFHWYQGDSEWTLAALHDVTNVHDGSHLKVQYKVSAKLADWRLVTRLSLTWKSANLHNYYYGIDAKDIEFTNLHYDAGAGIYGRISLSAVKKITENWSWLIHASYQSLPDAMADSPLVDKNYTITSFAGVTYRF